jgi:hypothetical protein
VRRRLQAAVTTVSHAGRERIREWQAQWGVQQKLYIVSYSLRAADAANEGALAFYLAVSSQVCLSSSFPSNVQRERKVQDWKSLFSVAPKGGGGNSVWCARVQRSRRSQLFLSVAPRPARSQSARSIPVNNVRWLCVWGSLVIEDSAARPSFKYQMKQPRPGPAPASFYPHLSPAAAPNARFFLRLWRC